MEYNKLGPTEQVRVGPVTTAENEYVKVGISQLEPTYFKQECEGCG
jgi:hypothetical protein